MGVTIPIRIRMHEKKIVKKEEELIHFRFLDISYNKETFTIKGGHLTSH